VRIAHEKFVSQSRARAEDKTLALFFKATRLRNALKVSGSVPIASSSATNAVDYAKFRGRSCRAVIRVYDEMTNVIETHEHIVRFQGTVDSFSSGFLTALQKASPATQQLMILENKFIAMFSLEQKLIAMSRTPTLARKLLIQNG
jgi:hypothetical protein